MDCFYCGVELLSFPDAHKLAARRNIEDHNKCRKFCMQLTSTQDHTTPKCLTRNNRNMDVVACCQTCNARKGQLTLEEFRIVQAFRYGQISGVELKFAGEAPNEEVNNGPDTPQAD